MVLKKVHSHVFAAWSVIRTIDTVENNIFTEFVHGERLNFFF